MFPEYHLVLPGAEFSIRTVPLLFWAVAGGLISRVLASVIRARAMVVGDYPDVHERDDHWTLRTAFRVCFGGFSGDKRHHDLWIPTMIVTIEFLAYPILMAGGFYVAVGGWLALKTSGQWAGWRTSRTAFNRFLLLSLLQLAYAFFVLMRFVVKLPQIHASVGPY